MPKPPPPFVFAFAATAGAAASPPTEPPKPKPSELPKPKPSELPKPQPSELPKPLPSELPKPLPSELPKPLPSMPPEPFKPSLPPPCGHPDAIANELMMSAPIFKHTLFRYLISNAASTDSELHHLNIKPTSLETRTSALTAAGYVSGFADPGLFSSLSGPTYLHFYAEDVLIIAPTAAYRDNAKTLLLSAFETYDQGPASCFQDILITRDRAARTIKLSQPRHTADLLSKFHSTDVEPPKTPFFDATSLTAEGELLDTTAFPFSSVIDSLKHIASCTRPDIAQAVGALAPYTTAPTTTHWTAAKHILSYLAGTADYGLIYGPAIISPAAVCAPCWPPTH